MQVVWTCIEAAVLFRRACGLAKIKSGDQLHIEYLHARSAMRRCVSALAFLLYLRAPHVLLHAVGGIPRPLL